METFIAAHWLDIVTTLLGLAYILLEYKASIWLWAVGFVMQAMDIVLYYQHGLYADCGMEFYYIAMTVYGFANWKFLHREKQDRSITHFEKKYILPWTVVTAVAWVGIWFFLVKFTDSRVPVADSFTTALSFAGVWALARKYLEQWLIWIAVDVVTCALYFYKGIPFKASLYLLYVFIAVAGYCRWRKEMNQPQKDGKVI